MGNASDERQGQTTQVHWPLVSVIIANLNGRRFLDDCLIALRDQGYPRLEIILVDNGSVDGSAAYVRARYPMVKVLESRQNLGFAGANNLGLGAASGDFVLLVNNDTKAFPGMVSAFVRAMQMDPRLGAAQGKLRLWRDPRLLDNGRGSQFTNTGFLMHLGHMEPDPECDLPRVMFAGKGACLCLRRSVLERTGLFDPAFISYFEDTDLCWRVWLSGYKVAFVPDAEILHVVGGATDEVTFSRVNFYSYKNRIRCLIKNLGLRRLTYVLPVHLMLCLAIMVMYIAGGKHRLAQGIAHALLWNCVHLPSSLQERRMVQGTVRAISDATLFDSTLAPLDVGWLFHYFVVYWRFIRSSM